MSFKNQFPLKTLILTTSVLYIINPLMNMSQADSSSPSKIKTHLSMTSSNNINLPTQRSNHKPDLIQDLYSKFMTLNNQVTIDHDLSAFNMIEYHRKDAKMENDQQVVMAKLKRLENNAELKRIDMQMENRKKKLSKQKNKEYFLLPQKQKYMITYRELTEKKIQPSFTSFEIERHNTDSDDEGNGQIERPKGISFFGQLKKHPKLLQYTVQQAKSRQKLKLEEINARQQKLDGFKNELKAVANNPVFKQTLNRQKQKEASPQRVADNIFRRFYTRKSKEQSLEQARAQTRISHFLDKQQSIMNSVDERSLSKQNYQKLKQKMTSIVNELYDDEKKHRSKTKLPSINPKRSVNNTIDK